MLSTVLVYVSLTAAVLSLVVSYFAFQMTLRATKDERDFRSLILHLTELEDMHAALAASHKRLRSRVGMRELRARKKNGQDGDDETPPDLSENEIANWKRQMRLKLHKGEIKP